MHNKNKIQFRQNTYNTSDSGIMFLLALIVPQFLMIVVMLACSAITKLPFSSPDPDVDTFVKIYPTFYTVLAGLVPQISMLASFLFISERKKVNYAKANKIKPILCSVLPAYRYSWKKSVRPDELIPQLNDLIKAYAKENKITYVDFFTPLVDNSPENRNGLPKKYSPDGVHPNMDGYAIMEEIILEVLK